VLAFNLFESLDMLTAAVRTLTDRCIQDISANRDRCRELVDGSIGVVTALVPVLGYEAASSVAKEALASGRPVREIVLERGLVVAAELERLLSPGAMTTPRPLV
jgi:aspartate ammonia-lyase